MTLNEIRLGQKVRMTEKGHVEANRVNYWLPGGNGIVQYIVESAKTAVILYNGKSLTVPIAYLKDATPPLERLAMQAE